MDVQKQIEFWLKASELDLKSAIDIFESKKNLHFCLFLCHLSIEKILKALIVKRTGEFPLKTHNLLRLAEIAKIDNIEHNIEFMEELNQFQISTRYPDDKFTIYKIASIEFTQEKLNRTRELHKWLKLLI